MKITRITESNRKTASYVGCPCAECSAENPDSETIPTATYMLTISKFSTCICTGCLEKLANIASKRISVKDPTIIDVYHTSYDNNYITRDACGNINVYEGIDLCPDAVKELIGKKPVKELECFSFEAVRSM